MKLLLDENLSRRIVPALQEAFPGSSQVVLVGLERANDRNVWEYAKTEGYVVVTKDDDFLRLQSLFGVCVFSWPNNRREFQLKCDRTAGATRVEVEWAPDSRKVAMVEDWPRGSAVFAAWTDTPEQTLLDHGMSPPRPDVWHKTLQADADEKAIITRLSKSLAAAW